MLTVSSYLDYYQNKGSVHTTNPSCFDSYASDLGYKLKYNYTICKSICKYKNVFFKYLFILRKRTKFFDCYRNPLFRNT